MTLLLTRGFVPRSQFHHFLDRYSGKYYAKKQSLVMIEDSPYEAHYLEVFCISLILGNGFAENHQSLIPVKLYC